MFKKIVLVATLFASVCGFAIADENDNWHKIILVGAEFLYNNQKIEDFVGDDIRMNSFGAGADVGYLSANKNNGFAFSLDLSFGGMFTSDITSDCEKGFFTNTYIGVGFAPLRTEKFVFAITGGIGLDNYNYIIEHKEYDSIIAGLNFIVGAELAFTAKLSRHFGIGVKVLGSVALAGAEFVDYKFKKDEYKYKEGDKIILDFDESCFISAGSFSIKPSIGMIFQF